MAGISGREGGGQQGVQDPGRAAQGAGAAGPGGPLIKDATTQSFNADVIVESARQPVLVDFWAPWCEPCKRLAPVLEKLVKAAAGKVKLVKMNIDEHPEIPTRLGVRSIPAVFAFHRGQLADGFLGSLPERDVKGFIERLAGPLGSADERIAEADALAAAGDAAAAAELYAQVLSENPSSPQAAGGLAKLLIAAGETGQARAILAAVGAEGERDPAVIAARAALHLAEQAASVGDSLELMEKIAANPNDHQARFDLALFLNSQNRREAAANELVEIVRRDRSWNDDAARKQLLQFFEAWGPMDPATIHARRKLSALLFS